MYIGQVFWWEKTFINGELSKPCLITRVYTIFFAACGMPGQIAAEVSQKIVPRRVATSFLDKKPVVTPATLASLFRNFQLWVDVSRTIINHPFISMYPFGNGLCNIYIYIWWFGGWFMKLFYTHYFQERSNGMFVCWENGWKPPTLAIPPSTSKEVANLITSWVNCSIYHLAIQH